MPCVFIPPSMREAAGGLESMEIAGRTVREVLEGLESRVPGIRDALCDGERLRPGLSVIVDGSVASFGLLQPVSERSEIHFLPSIGGG